MGAHRLLVVEDDHGLRDVLARGLRARDFEVVTAADGAGAIKIATAGDARLHGIVLDVGLPDSDGRDVCQALRARGVTAPVIFLTARRDVGDRLSGFASGGDDYLTKPFAFPELVARIEVMVRRTLGTPTTVVDDLSIDPVAHTVRHGERQANLTPIEYRLLARLLANSAAVVRRAQLREAGWPMGAIVSENTLDQYVAKLRRRLVEVGSPRAIRLVRGVGYQLR